MSMDSSLDASARSVVTPFHFSPLVTLLNWIPDVFFSVAVRQSGRAWISGDPTQFLRKGGLGPGEGRLRRFRASIHLVLQCGSDCASSDRLGLEQWSGGRTLWH